jgi:formylglycine-generating enzyme required for sulfatase activity
MIRAVPALLGAVLATLILAACGFGSRDPREDAQRTVVPERTPAPPRGDRGFDSVRIPKGSYPLGIAGRNADERPAHRVRLAGFRIDRYEVTNSQFAGFLNSLEAEPMRDRPAGSVSEGDLRGPDAPLLVEAPEDAPARAELPLVALDDEQSRIALAAGRFAPQTGFGRHPVNEVTWYGARAFCAWRGGRLPTEAEWEAAGRGLEGRTYPWGGAPPSSTRAVYGQASNETAAVGSHPAGATPQGVHDLAGNVAEWTSSLYRPYPYDPRDGRENPRTVGERVTRGGDHVSTAPEDLAASFRTGFSRAIERGHRHIGFRCARSLR